MGERQPIEVACAPHGGGAAIRRLLHPVAVSLIVTHLTLIGLAWWALQHWVPDTLVLHLFGHDHLVSQVHRRLIDRTIEISVLLPSIFLFEYLWTGWARSSVRHLLIERPPSSWSDAVCYLFQLAPAWTLVSAVMSFGVVYVSGEWLRRHLVQATGIDFSIAGAPLLVQTTVLFLLYTLLDYWSHRLDHTRAFWPLHRFHHSAESFCVLTAARVHPAMFTAVVSAILPGVLLASDRAALAYVTLVIIIIRLVIHSRIESSFGWVGRWLVQSPLHHRRHHSIDSRPMNFGLLPLWDRLFGTWCDVPEEARPIGTKTPYRHGAWIGPDIWRDYLEFGTGIKRLLVGRLARFKQAVPAPES
jgi:sterol desaturase/sphingolipid hydroxylase (fatty acid hydroxylase superfamily)